MTKKDYVKFANLFLKLRSDKQWNNWNGEIERQLLNGIITIFKEDNKSFNSDTFLNYINKNI